MWQVVSKLLLVTVAGILLGACAGPQESGTGQADPLVAVPEKAVEKTVWEALAENRPVHHAGFMHPSRARQLSVADSRLLSAPYQAQSCQSDLDCPMHQACIKQVASMTGTCLIAVDRRGDPTTYMPNPASEAVLKEPRCEGSGDCAVGFTCDRRLNACVR